MVLDLLAGDVETRVKTEHVALKGPSPPTPLCHPMAVSRTRRQWTKRRSKPC